MDTTLKYIKMCEQAQEIQELRKQIYKIGDNFNVPSLNDQVYTIPNSPITYSIIEENFYLSIRANTWLPRQDQLQEIISTNNLHSYFPAFYRFCKEDYENGLNFLTFEQLWLAFVMKEKHNKIWNEETENWDTL